VCYDDGIVAPAITFNGADGREYTHRLQCTDGDGVMVFQEDDKIYVLEVNWAADCASLEVFNGPNKVGDLFANHRVLDEAKIDDRLPLGAIIRRLEPYLNHDRSCS
jgi:hypothetical protein